MKSTHISVVQNARDNFGVYIRSEDGFEKLTSNDNVLEYVSNVLRVNRDYLSIDNPFVTVEQIKNFKENDQMISLICYN